MVNFDLARDGTLSHYSVPMARHLNFCSLAFHALIGGVIWAMAFHLPAALKLPALFTDNMVLQRDQPDFVWGWDDPGTSVEVAIAGQTKTSKADASGKWSVQLDALKASSTPLTMSVKGSSVVEIKNILVGEVWMCSGQSNMAFPLGDADNAELEVAGMKHSGIRLITVPNLGTQEPQKDFTGAWAVCTPETAKDFSAIGLYYGRYLHEILGVPVGLICNAWGGSYIEAWLPRPVLEHDPHFAEIMEQVVKAEGRATSPKSIARYEQQVADWEKEAAEAEKQNLPRPKHPRDPRDFMPGNQRVGNIYNGVLFPTIGYGIKGVIWYQGEANTADAKVYELMFPLLIKQWRKDWNRDELPFYWVQLPNHGARTTELVDGLWPALRDAQTKATKLPHTGQAVTVDIGDGNSLHPKNKLDVAARLARWALAKDYGMDMPCRSPLPIEVTLKAEGKIALRFDSVGRGLVTRQSDSVTGFALCGADKKWHWAHGDIVDYNLVEVSSEAVPKPIAIRYCWTDNPECNLFTREGLPATPFRTDDFELVLPEKPAPAPPPPAASNGAAPAPAPK